MGGGGSGSSGSSAGLINHDTIFLAQLRKFTR